MQSKKRRHQVLLSVIQKRTLSTQQELVEQLVKQRIVATQSSVSRDLEELGIVKIHGFYSAPLHSRSALSRGILGVECAGDALVVVKCDAGHASAVTVEIDKTELPDIVGTIAGDDTIFIAVRSKSAQKTVLEKIRQLANTPNQMTVSGASLAHDAAGPVRRHS